MVEQRGCAACAQSGRAVNRAAELVEQDGAFGQLRPGAAPPGGEIRRGAMRVPRVGQRSCLTLASHPGRNGTASLGEVCEACQQSFRRHQDESGRQIIYLHPDTVTVKASCREGTPDESDGNGGCMR